MKTPKISTVINDSTVRRPSILKNMMRLVRKDFILFFCSIITPCLFSIIVNCDSLLGMLEIAGEGKPLSIGIIIAYLWFWYNGMV